MSNLAQRMMGAAKLRVATYEEVEADRSATGQALAVVVLTSVATGLGFSRTWTVSVFVVGSVASVLR